MLREAGKAIMKFTDGLATARDSIAEGKPSGEVTALKVLGIDEATITSDAMTTGEKLMLSLKNSMTDNKLDNDEIESLNVLFGGRIALDMAQAASAIGDMSMLADEALNAYQGSVENAAAVTDDNIGSKMTQIFQDMKSEIFASSFWQGGISLINGFLDAVVAMQSGAASGWLNTLKPAWAEIQPFVGATFGSVTTILDDAKETAGNVFRVLGEFWTVTLKPAWQGIAPEVSGIFASMGEPCKLGYLWLCLSLMLWFGCGMES